MKTKSIGKKPAAGSAKGSAKIHAVKPPKPAKRTWTITLPQEIAEIAEQQYQLIKKNAPKAIENKHDFVRGLVFAGIAAMRITFSMVDQMIDIEEQHTGKVTLNRRRGVWGGSVAVMDPAKTVGIMQENPYAKMTYRGEKISMNAAPKKPSLRVVNNNVTPIKSAVSKRAKKAKTDGPPDAA